jgi:hypothetical protein
MPAPSNEKTYAVAATTLDSIQPPRRYSRSLPGLRACEAVAATAPPSRYDVALTAEGVVIVELDDMFDSYILTRHWREVIVYLVTRDGAAIREFDGVSVGGYALVSDPADLDSGFAGNEGSAR